VFVEDAIARCHQPEGGNGGVGKDGAKVVVVVVVVVGGALGATTRIRISDCARMLCAVMDARRAYIEQLNQELIAKGQELFDKDQELFAKRQELFAKDHELKRAQEENLLQEKYYQDDMRHLKEAWAAERLRLQQEHAATQEVWNSALCSL
jgi:Skp family chaperone for outer membrane proteins